KNVWFGKLDASFATIHVIIIAMIPPIKIGIQPSAAIVTAAISFEKVRTPTPITKEGIAIIISRSLINSSAYLKRFKGFFLPYYQISRPQLANTSVVSKLTEWANGK